MKKKRRLYILAAILGIAVLIVCILLIAIIIGVGSLSKKAKAFAENFLSTKYQTQMVYESIDSDFINGGWRVYFHPENNSEINFNVRVFNGNNGITVFDGEEGNSQTGYIYTADNYLFSYMAFYIKKEYEELTEKIWGDEIRISVTSLYYPYPIIPIGANEEMTPEELSLLWDYRVNISSDVPNIDYIYDEKTEISEKIFKTITEMKSFDYTPNKIDFSFYSHKGIFYKKIDKSVSIEFENRRDITSLSQVEEIVNAELAAEN
ncbi:MAG: hypothetical protein LUC92_01555 [Clostridiales bacterium]|nr:hypothetical protein [Clostridiales bacterium]